VKHQNMVVAIAAIFLTACGTLSQVKEPVNDVKDEVVEVVEAVEVEVVEVEVTKPVSKIKTIGQVEYVDILPQGIRQKGRIDTGAETTSIGVLDIVPFERDGNSWVKFKIQHRDTGKIVEFSKHVERTAVIKRHGAENVERPVVKMTLAIGLVEQAIEVSLADRSKFEYPVLIGRNFLDGKVAVDVSSKFLMLDK
jgi:hypothetical protein